MVGCNNKDTDVVSIQIIENAQYKTEVYSQINQDFANDYRKYVILAIEAYNCYFKNQDKFFDYGNQDDKLIEYINKLSSHTSNMSSTYNTKDNNKEKEMWLKAGKFNMALLGIQYDFLQCEKQLLEGKEMPDEKFKKAISYGQQSFLKSKEILLEMINYFEK